MKRFLTFASLFLCVLLASAYQLLDNAAFFQRTESAVGLASANASTERLEQASPSPETVWTFEAEFDVPRHVLTSYFEAIEEERYKFAYLLWDQEGTASGMDFDGFQARFGNVKQAKLVFLSQGEMGEAEGFRYFKQPITLETEDHQGIKKSFQAEYTLRQPVHSKVSETWRIYNLSYQQER